MKRSFSNFIWIGGLSLLFIPIALFFQPNMATRPEYLILFSFPHFVLSYFIYYKHLRTLRVRTPEIVRLFGLFVVLGLSFALWKELQVLVIYTAQAIFLYHLALQAFGVTIIYSASPLRDDKTWRRLLKAMFLSWAAAAWLEQQTSLASLTFFKTNVSSLQLPPDVAIYFTRLSLILTATAIAFYIAKTKEVEKFNFKRDIFPLTGIISFAAWCLPQTQIAASGLIAVFHGIQYLPFALSNLQTKLQSRVALGSTLVVSLLLGVLVFDQVPRWLSTHDPVRSTFAISCIYLTLNLFHFFLETKVWKRFKAQPVQASSRAA